MYAIVDIETTGSHPHENGITEIAIVLHNGKEIEGCFETLINPGVSIPKYIAALTGISNFMVEAAPSFAVLADKIYNLLKDRIFIAHNVNFDYSFIKHHLRETGYDLTTKKLCTIRLSRKAFPNVAKYGLGSICRELNIENDSRHRAAGDAYATAILFDKILKQEGDTIIKEFLRKDNREQMLPPNLPAEVIKHLPFTPGVYYFHNAVGKVIYVGKAKCIKYRIISHFSGFDIGKKRQEFLRNIHSISYKECPTEFAASLFESIEIKRLWPAYNISQKRFNQLFAVYCFEDAAGYLRLCIDKKRRHLQPLASFSMLGDAYNFLWKLIKNFELDPVLCFVDTSFKTSFEGIDLHNQKVNDALNWLQQQKETFVIKQTDKQTTFCILVEQGKFYGMGTLPEDASHSSIESLKDNLTPYPENEVIISMIRSYAERNPASVMRFDANYVAAY